MKQENISRYKCGRCGQIVEIQNKTIGIIPIPKRKPKTFKKIHGTYMCKHCIEQYEQTYKTFMTTANKQVNTG